MPRNWRRGIVSEEHNLSGYIGLCADGVGGWFYDEHVDVVDDTHLVTSGFGTGFLQIVDTPHYARFECPEGGSTFSLSLEDESRHNPTVIYFEHRTAHTVNCAGPGSPPTAKRAVPVVAV